MNSLSDAVAELPAWLPWVHVLHIPLFGAAMSAVVLSLALRVMGSHRLPDATVHWTERARRIFPMMALIHLGTFIPLGLYGYLSFVRPGPIALIRGAGLALISIAAIEAATTAVVWRLVRRIYPDLDFRRWLRGRFATALIFWSPLYATLLMALFADTEFDATTLIAVVAGGLLVVGAAAGGGWAVAVATGLARPAPPWLDELVREIGRLSGRKPHGVFVIDLPMSNALALPIQGDVAFTDRMIGALDRDQIAAIAAHEIGHLTESRLVVVRRLTGALLLLVLGCARPLWALGGFPLLGGAVLLALLAVIPSRRFLRRMEERADDHAIEHAHGSTEVYAAALERMHRDNLTPAVLGKTHQTHPDLYDRMLAAGVEPDYARPAPPRSTRLGVTLIAGLLIASHIGLVVADTMLVNRAGQGLGWSRAAFVATGGHARLFFLTGWQRLEDGDTRRALAPLGAATELEPDVAFHHAALATCYARLGDVPAAGTALARALELRIDDEWTDYWIDAAHGALERATGPAENAPR